MKCRAYFKPIASFIAIVALAFFLAIFTATPSNDLEFSTPYKVLPSSTLNQGNLYIQKMRDFSYHSDGSIKNIRHIDKIFPMRQLKRTWLGISHFQPGGLAHIFLSFEFATDDNTKENEYLVVSIEARLTRQHNHFNPIKGLFRQYNKTVVLATEQDVIGLRSHIRGERVLLYPLRISNIQQHALLLDFTRMANELTTHPDFYNSLTDNCLTGLMSQSYYFQENSHRLDYRVLLPGYADGLAQELGIIDLKGSLKEIREQATINPESFSIEDPLFSQLIRSKH